MVRRCDLFTDLKRAVCLDTVAGSDENTLSSSVSDVTIERTESISVAVRDADPTSPKSPGNNPCRLPAA